jgi:hypothetical protein
MGLANLGADSARQMTMVVSQTEKWETEKNGR